MKQVNIREGQEKRLEGSTHSQVFICQTQTPARPTQREGGGGRLGEMDEEQQIEKRGPETRGKTTRTREIKQTSGTGQEQGQTKNRRSSRRERGLPGAVDGQFTKHTMGTWVLAAG